jgi:secernin
LPNLWTCRAITVFNVVFDPPLDGYRNISNQYSITTKIDKEHPGMRDYAKSHGWWDGKAPFSFAETYSFMTTARIEASGSRYCEGRNLLERSKGELNM